MTCRGRVVDVSEQGRVAHQDLERRPALARRLALDDGGAVAVRRVPDHEPVDAARREGLDEGGRRRLGHAALEEVPPEHDLRGEMWGDVLEMGGRCREVPPEHDRRRPRRDAVVEQSRACGSGDRGPETGVRRRPKSGVGEGGCGSRAAVAVAHREPGTRYGEIWGDMGRYGEIWGDMGSTPPREPGTARGTAELSSLTQRGEAVHSPRRRFLEGS